MAVLGLLALLFLELLAPAGAVAAQFGTWWPQPGKQAGSRQISAYQAELEPFNSEQASEMTSVGCVLPSGIVLTDREEEMLRNIFANAGRVYNGTFKWAKNNAEDLDEDRPGYTKNGGYEKSGVSEQQRMRWFLEDMVTLIRFKDWAPPEQHIELEKEQHDNDSAYSKHIHPGRKPDLWIDVDNDQTTPYEIHDNKRRNAIISLITRGYNAPTPIQLYTGVGDRAGIPAGCDLGGYTPQAPGGIGDLFDDPFNFAMNLIGFVLIKPFGQLYNIAYGPALQYSFWTPHTERGDTIFTIASNCGPDERKEDPEKTRYTCKSANKPLGFDKRTQSGSWQPGWLGVRNVLQWLISGSYFLLLFTAAVVFIFRGTASQTFNVMRMVPRLLLSILFTLFSSFIIGAMISTSNILVQAMFNPKDHANFSAINAIMQNPSIAAGREDGLGNMFDLIVIAPSALFVSGMAAISFIRQIVLIALVILTPVASFCLIIDKWQRHFTRWLMALLAVVSLPVIIGLILNIGLRVNPLIAAPLSAYGKTLGMLGVFLLVLTLWFMFRVSRSAIAAAANSKLVGSSVTGSLAGWGASKLGRGSALGKMLGGYAGATAASSAIGAKLVPPEKITGRSQIGGLADTAAGLTARSARVTGQAGKSLAVRSGRGAYNLATNTPADRIRAFTERRALRKSGGYELRPEEAANLLTMAQQYSGIDADTWNDLDQQVKANWVKRMVGYDRVHLGNDGRMFVRESAEQIQRRGEATRALARQRFYYGDEVDSVVPVPVPQDPADPDPTGAALGQDRPRGHEPEPTANQDPDRRQGPSEGRGTEQRRRRRRRNDSDQGLPSV